MPRKVAFLLMILIFASSVMAGEYPHVPEQSVNQNMFSFSSSRVDFADDLQEDLDLSYEEYLKLKENLLTKTDDSVEILKNTDVDIISRLSYLGTVDITFSFKPAASETDKKVFQYTYERFNGGLERLVILSIPQEKVNGYNYLLNLGIR